jgi:hypothetical protein
MYWPARIVSSVKEFGKKSKLRIKYFEADKIGEYSFKMDFSQIDLFFDSNHFDHKVISFFLTYLVYFLF